MDNMNRLYLADLSGMTEDEVRDHISKEYAGDGPWGPPYDADVDEVRADLERFDILVAYEHVGSWGCDSSSYFLLRERATGDLFDFNGGHCSCYGFEGQYGPEKTTKEYLCGDSFSFYGGGYDDNYEKHKQMMVEFFRGMEGK